MARYQDSAASESRFADLNSKLRRFKRKNKRETDVSLAQFDWLREYSSLKREEESAKKIMIASIVSLSGLLLDEVATTSERIIITCESNTSLSAGEEERSENTFEDECLTTCFCVKCASDLSAELVAKIGSLQGTWEEEIHRLSVVMKEVRNCLAVLKGEQEEYIDGDLSNCCTNSSDSLPSGKKKFCVAAITNSTNYLDFSVSDLKGNTSTSSYLGNALVIMRDNFKHKLSRLDKELSFLSADIKETRKSIRRTLIGDVNVSHNDIVPAELRESVEYTRHLLTEQSSDDYFDDGGDINILEFDFMYQKIYQSFTDLKEHHKKMTLQAFEKFGASCPGVSPNDPFGGWDEKEHLRFLNGLNRKTNIKVDSVCNSFPDRNVKEIQRYVIWWEQYRFLKEKCNAARLSLQKKVSSLCKVSIKKIDSFVNAMRVRAANKINISLKGICRDERQARLEALREVTEEVSKHDAKQRAKEQLERKLIHEQVTKQKNARARTLKIAVNKLKRERHEQDEKDKVAAIALSNADNEERCQRIERNKGRVSHRVMLRKMKQDREENARRQAENDAERRARELLALASCVPYHDSILSMKPVYRTKSTISRQNDVYQEDTSGRASFQHGMRKFTSFTNEKVFSNALFRLGNALHDAGIAQSAYARAAVKRLVPREPERTTGIVPF